MATTPAKPTFPIYNVYKQDLIFLGSTKYGKIVIPIYVAHNPEREDEWEWEAFYDWHHGQGTVVIWSGLKPKRLGEILTHEFTHVIESLNHHTYLDREPYENCTLLAQTMEKGMTELWRNLRLVKVPGNRARKPRRRNAK